MRGKRTGSEVVVADDSVVQLGRGDVTEMTIEAAKTERSRIRFCAHAGVDDWLHEMFIVHQKGTYIPPHKHLNKCESAHIIDGSVTCVVFDEAGAVVRAIPMGDYQSGRDFYYRMSQPYYHTLLIHSDWVIFHETTTGPFNRDETVFAPWAPAADDVEGQRQFMARLQAIADDWLQQAKSQESV